MFQFFIFAWKSSNWFKIQWKSFPFFIYIYIKYVFIIIYMGALRSCTWDKPSEHHKPIFRLRRDFWHFMLNNQFFSLLGKFLGRPWLYKHYPCFKTYINNFIVYRINVAKLKTYISPYICTINDKYQNNKFSCYHFHFPPLWKMYMNWV